MKSIEPISEEWWLYMYWIDWPRLKFLICILIAFPSFSTPYCVHATLPCLIIRSIYHIYVITCVLLLHRMSTPPLL